MANQEQPEARAVFLSSEHGPMSPPPSQKYTLWMRVGTFTAGVGFLGLAAVDAMFDPFPGPETFFGGTGVVLIGIGVTGKAPKKNEGS